jgi:hypothetical protein
MIAAKTLLAVVAAVALTGCGLGSAGETRYEMVSLDLDQSKSISVELGMGSGEMRVTSGTLKLMEGRFTYNVADWKPVVDYRAGGTLRLSQPNSSGSRLGSAVNNWDVKLNSELPLNVTANLGAGEANLDLGKLNLNRVEIRIVAGRVDVDLRGEPKHDYTVQIRGGVGETVVHLPRDVAIAATASEGIGDISIEGLEHRDGVWVNPDRIGAPVTVRVHAKGGIGKIRLMR